MKNIFSLLPKNLTDESFDELLHSKNIKIERIISKGHCSPKKGWYEQKENEWVLVLEGTGKILFEDGKEVKLEKGDYLNIPSYTKHRVTWTDPNNMTIWLAIHYSL